MRLQLIVFIVVVFLVTSFSLSESSQGTQKKVMSICDCRYLYSEEQFEKFDRIEIGSVSDSRIVNCFSVFHKNSSVENLPALERALEVYSGSTVSSSKYTKMVLISLLWLSGEDEKYFHRLIDDSEDAEIVSFAIMVLVRCWNDDIGGKLQSLESRLKSKGLEKEFRGSLNKLLNMKWFAENKYLTITDTRERFRFATSRVPYDWLKMSDLHETIDNWAIGEVRRLSKQNPELLAEIILEYSPAFDDDSKLSGPPSWARKPDNPALIDDYYLIENKERKKNLPNVIERYQSKFMPIVGDECRKLLERGMDLQKQNVKGVSSMDIKEK